MREKILVVLKLLPWLLLLAAPEVMARTILVFGDSLSAGYGIRQEAAWPALLQNRLQERRFDYSVVNASISGETTAGGRSRLEAALSKHQPSVLVLALGANDGLRGLPLAVMRDNLAAMIKAARRQQIKVLLVGMRLPPNFGAYADDFHRSFAELARQEKLAYVDFLLDGVADKPQLFQADNLHPLAEAQPRLLDNVWAGLAPLLSGR